MTAAQSAEVTAFISHPVLRAAAAARLLSGAVYLCPDCQQIAASETGWRVSDEARFEAQAPAYDLLLDGRGDEYALRADCNAYGY